MLYCRRPEHCKETQTAVVWSNLSFIRPGQNHLARHSERGKKTRQTEEELGRQHQGKDRPGVRQVPEGSGVQGKMDETGCEIICGAPTTLTVKGEMRDEMRDCHTDHHYHYTYTSPQNVAHTHPLSVCFSVTFIWCPEHYSGTQAHCTVEHSHKKLPWGKLLLWAKWFKCPPVQTALVLFVRSLIKKKQFHATMCFVIRGLEVLLYISDRAKSPEKIRFERNAKQMHSSHLRQRNSCEIHMNSRTLVAADVLYVFAHLTSDQLMWLIRSSCFTFYMS